MRPFAIGYQLGTDCAAGIILTVSAGTTAIEPQIPPLRYIRLGELRFARDDNSLRKAVCWKTLLEHLCWKAAADSRQPIAGNKKEAAWRDLFSLARYCNYMP